MRFFLTFGLIFYIILGPAWSNSCSEGCLSKLKARSCRSCSGAELFQRHKTLGEELLETFEDQWEDPTFQEEYKKAGKVLAKELDLVDSTSGKIKFDKIPPEYLSILETQDGEKIFFPNDFLIKKLGKQFKESETFKKLSETFKKWRFVTNQTSKRFDDHFKDNYPKIASKKVKLGLISSNHFHRQPAICLNAPQDEIKRACIEAYNNTVEIMGIGPNDSTIFPTSVNQEIAKRKREKRQKEIEARAQRENALLLDYERKARVPEDFGYNDMVCTSAGGMLSGVTKTNRAEQTCKALLHTPLEIFTKEISALMLRVDTMDYYSVARLVSLSSSLHGFENQFGEEINISQVPNCNKKYPEGLKRFSEREPPNNIGSRKRYLNSSKYCEDLLSGLESWSFFQKEYAKITILDCNVVSGSGKDFNLEVYEHCKETNPSKEKEKKLYQGLMAQILATYPELSHGRNGQDLWDMTPTMAKIEELKNNPEQLKQFVNRQLRPGVKESYYQYLNRLCDDGEDGIKYKDIATPDLGKFVRDQFPHLKSFGECIEKTRQRVEETKKNLKIIGTLICVGASVVAGAVSGGAGFIIGGSCGGADLYVSVDEYNQSKEKVALIQQCLMEKEKKDSTLLSKSIESISKMSVKSLQKLCGSKDLQEGLKKQKDSYHAAAFSVAGFAFDVAPVVRLTNLIKKLGNKTAAADVTLTNTPKIADAPNPSAAAHTTNQPTTSSTVATPNRPLGFQVPKVHEALDEGWYLTNDFLAKLQNTTDQFLDYFGISRPVTNQTETLLDQFLTKKIPSVTEIPAEARSFSGRTKAYKIKSTDIRRDAVTNADGKHALNNPKIKKHLKDLEEWGVTVIVDDTLKTVGYGGSFDAASKTLRIPADAPYDIFLHEFNHAQFNHSLRSYEELIENFVRNGEAPDFPNKWFNKAVEMRKRGLSMNAIDENFAVFRQLSYLKKKGYKMTDHKWIETRSYGLKHTIISLKTTAKKRSLTADELHTLNAAEGEQLMLEIADVDTVTNTQFSTDLADFEDGLRFIERKSRRPTLSSSTRTLPAAGIVAGGGVISVMRNEQTGEYRAVLKNGTVMTIPSANI